LTLALFGLIIALPVSRAFFELAPLGLLDYLAIGSVAIGWGFLVRFIWRARLFDRFLGISLNA
jgi:cation-transporting ATPase E